MGAILSSTCSIWPSMASRSSAGRKSAKAGSSSFSRISPERASTYASNIFFNSSILFGSSSEERVREGKADAEREEGEGEGEEEDEGEREGEREREEEGEVKSLD